MFKVNKTMLLSPRYCYGTSSVYTREIVAEVFICFLRCNTWHAGSGGGAVGGDKEEGWGCTLVALAPHRQESRASRARAHFCNGRRTGVVGVRPSLFLDSIHKKKIK